MNTHAERTTENKNMVVANDTSQKSNENNSTFQFADNRPETISQRKLQKISNTDSQTTPIAQLKNYANNYSVKIAQKKAIEEEEPMQGKFNTIQKKGLEEEELLQGKFNTIQKQALEEEELLQGKFKTLQKQEIDEEELLQGKFAPIQKKENNTGLPDNLKSGIENLSGHSLDDVKVHYNSDKPAQLNAHAYAQGTDIHLGSGQEKHLPHEAWHVVQQKQGRVKPTMQMKGNVNVNDDVGLEKEADVMGEKALQIKNMSARSVQKKDDKNMNISLHKLGETVQLVDLYRGMQASAPEANAPLLGNTSGFQLGVRDNEGTNNAGGYVNPASGGTSTSNPRGSIPNFTASKYYPEGNHNTDDKTKQSFRWIWSLDDANLPNTLTARNDHDDHYSIEPAVGQQLSRAQFRTAVQGTQGDWNRIDN